MNELTDSSIFVLNDQTLGVIEELGAHMPGGFFILRGAGTRAAAVREQAGD
ncbi:MAG: hypothetical protein IJG17_00335 [Eubacterium sp.]|nr:hypothetical protein [Eubacterium sp.]MBQ6364378.1 hypothetical protein [Lachnospiraceae bacterium]